MSTSSHLLLLGAILAAVYAAPTPSEDSWAEATKSTALVDTTTTTTTEIAMQEYNQVTSSTGTMQAGPFQGTYTIDSCKQFSYPEDVTVSGAGIGKGPCPAKYTVPYGGMKYAIPAPSKWTVGSQQLVDTTSTEKLLAMEDYNQVQSSSGTMNVGPFTGTYTIELCKDFQYPENVVVSGGGIGKGACAAKYSVPYAGMKAAIPAPTQWTAPSQLLVDTTSTNKEKAKAQCACVYEQADCAWKCPHGICVKC